VHEEIVKYIAVYIEREFLDQLSREEFIALSQIFRVQNSLGYHLVKLVEASKEVPSIISTFQQIEETFLIASTIRESMKALFSRSGALYVLEKRLNEASVHTELCELKDYYAKFGTEPRLKFLDMIRNDFSYHFKDTIYKDAVSDGPATQALRICVGLDDRNENICYQPPVDCALNQVGLFVDKHKITEAPDQYLFNTVNDEATRLYQFLNQFLASILHGHKKETWEEI
jgi:hypothetical protein